MICKHGFTTSTALLLALGMSQVLADPTPYKGTATLCFIGAAPPTVKQAGKDGVRSVSGLVSLYYIQTTPPGGDPSVGLVNGWELLTSDMKITGEEYQLDWTGVLTPTAYADTTGTVLEETASIETKDLSMLSGTWLGTGDLAGTRVDYTLTVIPGAQPDCPSEHPPQCKDIEGGCLPAAPPAVREPTVYDMSGVVN
jgi:hypothetical protein